MAQADLDLRYPKDIVKQYGAKAGLLLYVNEQLPKIPQMPMVVSEQGEDPLDFVSRIKKRRLKSPWLFRSSAEAELMGLEGDLPTIWVHHEKYYDEWHIQTKGAEADYPSSDRFTKRRELDIALAEQVRMVAESPQKMHWSWQKKSRDLLPDRINVLATSVAPSEYIGTYIKHPNRSDFYIATIKDAQNDNLKLSVTIDGQRDQILRFGTDLQNLVRTNERMINQFWKVTDWHDQIAALPEMDPDWSYQIEFGLLPARLFQIRPFKRTELANFTVDPQPNTQYHPLVMGITSPEGKDYEVVRRMRNRYFATDLPKIYADNLRDMVIDKVFEYDIDGVPDALVLGKSAGLLEHGDIKALRQSELSILYPDFAMTDLYPGVIARVISDGRNLQVIPREA